MTTSRLLALLVLSVIGAAPAPAGDRCLQGTSVLTDQRALATLRADEDSACPCTTTGGRSAYRRCARAVVNAAVDGGSVRRECKKTAKRDVSSATCGTSDETCGGSRPTKPGADATCTVRSASSCHDRGSTQSTACAAETHCSDVVTWTAGTCLDGRQAGPWHVGARTTTFTKPSVVDPMATRVLDTVIWYPTTDTGPIDADTGAILDATVDPSAAPYPIVMFSHGNCSFPEQSKFLTVQLATYGYVVVAPSHPNSTLPECLAGTNNLVRSALERPSEITSVLDQMLAANDTVGSPFFGTIDSSRIGMAGHSFGGWTTFKVASADARFKVAVPMAGDPVPPPALTVPLLAMTGLEDTFVTPASVVAAYDAAVGPKVLVEIEHAGHFAFSDGCIPGHSDCNYPVTLSQNEAHAVVLRWVVPFLERYLRGAPRLEGFFTAAPPPGVQVQSQL